VCTSTCPMVSFSDYSHMPDSSYLREKGGLGRFTGDEGVREKCLPKME